jgi:DNA topoisomerase-2
MDGFNAERRKVLFACIKKDINRDMNVAQLAHVTQDISAYRHGSSLLEGAIINMAQSFIGSNNVNLLTPSCGHFGTRHMGGKDAASPHSRNMFTKLEKVTRIVFHPDDDAILSYLSGDHGMVSIEPEFYVPVIPLVLVNGWPSNVPNFDPFAIIGNLRRLIAGEVPEKMVPCYLGFTGEIVPEEIGRGEGSFVVRGRIERKNDTTLIISELPIKKWTQDYKVLLESMTNSDETKEPEIKDFQENHTDTTISFTITASKKKIDAFEKKKNGLYGKFKLTGSLSTSNMTLFDKEGCIARYDKPEDILAAFYDLRLEYYSRRKDLLLENLRKEQTMLSNKARFLEEVCSGDLVVSHQKRTDIFAQLHERGYDRLQKEDQNQTNVKANTPTDAQLVKSYDYLLGMQIWSLTLEKAEELRAKLAEKTHKIAELAKTSPSQIWLNDLDAIEESLDVRYPSARKLALASRTGNVSERDLVLYLVAQDDFASCHAFDAGRSLSLQQRSYHDRTLYLVPETLRDDYEVMHAVSAKCPWSFRFASGRLLSSSDFINEAIEAIDNTGIVAMEILSILAREILKQHVARQTLQDHPDCFIKMICIGDVPRVKALFDRHLLEIATLPWTREMALA